MFPEPVVALSSAPEPNAVLLPPVVFSLSALAPLPVLSLPVLPDSAPAPKAALLSPVVLLNSAPLPLAVLLEPMALFCSAVAPLAVLLSPEMLLSSAVAPLAVLLEPMSLFCIAATPLAVLPEPLVLSRRAWTPVAVLLSPLVLRLRARSPVAVLRAPRGVAFEGAGAQGGVTPASVVAEEGALAQSGVAASQLLHVSEVAVDIDDQMRADDGLHQDGPVQDGLVRPEPDIHGVGHILAGVKIHHRRCGKGSARPGDHVPTPLRLGDREIQRGGDRRQGDATHPANLDGGGHVRREGRSREPRVERPAGGGERDVLRPAEGLRGGEGGQAERQGEPDEQHTRAHRAHGSLPGVAAGLGPGARRCRWRIGG